MRILFLVVLLLCFYQTPAQNQQNILWKPEWQSPILMKVGLGKSPHQKIPFCKDCLYDTDYEFLPLKTYLIPLQNNSYQLADVSTQFKNEDFRIDLRYSALKLQGNSWYPEQLIDIQQIVYDKGKPFLPIKVYGAQVNGQGQIRLVENIEFKLQAVPFSQPSQKVQRTYAPSSILSNGLIYKLGVVDNGVYKITRTQMAQMGFDVERLDPRKIKIYGNGGRMLPQSNSVAIYDDLFENAIYVHGEDDGSFDANDYILFYGESPHRINWDTVGCVERHIMNIYSDSTFYFIKVDDSNGKRVNFRANGSNTGTSITTCKTIQWIEEEQVNLLQTGRLWLGPIFDFVTSRDYNFPIYNIVQGSDLTIRTRVFTRGGMQSSWTLSYNGTVLSTIIAASVNIFSTDVLYASNTYNCKTIAQSQIGNNLIINLKHNKTFDSVGWLDFIEIEYEQNLKHFGNSYVFRIGHQGNASVALEGNQNLWIWDVTHGQEPIIQQSNHDNTYHRFNFTANNNLFVSFDPNQLPSPIWVHRIDNQNLHALDWANYLLITPVELRSAAEQLADFHRNKYQRKVHVVNIHEIFNEFGGGRRDVTAIRNFIKMFYDRASGNPEQRPQWVLLFGDGHHDPKNRVQGVNYIPTYQSRESLNPPFSYVSDDYFTFLDDSEGNWGETTEIHYSDLAIGRLPVESLEDAQNVVNKIINYASKPETFGEWRNRVLFVGDVKLGGSSPECNHMNEADNLSKKVEQNSACIYIDKVYLDTYPAVNSPDGIRFPQAKTKLLEKAQAGSLIINYTGHGGEDGWSNAKIFEIPDIQALSNSHALPMYITATCEFGRWDEYNFRCGGEWLLSNSKGGAIGLLTAVRVVFSSANFAINTRFYDYVFSFDSTLQTHYSIGEIYRLTKNATFPVANINTRSYSLLMDPGLILNYPEKKIVITQVNQNSNGQDTIKARQLVTLKGEVRNYDNTLDQSFNGTLNATIFDKTSVMRAINCGNNFALYRNILFNGQVTVQNGTFTVQFVVPIDISYEIGTGKFIFYAQSSSADAVGCRNDVVVCCTDITAPTDNQPPTVNLFLNDTCCWINGGVTSQNPNLIALIRDDMGINTSGLGVGRELIAIIDNDVNNPIILNDHYKANKDSYNSGKIEYRLQNLPSGEHCIQIKVWDVNNNSATDETCFIVENNAKLVIDKLLNYPNPFTTQTQFFFEHNRAGDDLDIKIDIFTISGKLIKTLQDKIFADNKICNRIEWDGLDEFGDRIGRGTYIYRVTVRAPRTGDVVSKYEKLVILR